MTHPDNILPPKVGEERNFSEPTKIFVSNDSGCTCLRFCQTRDPKKVSGESFKIICQFQLSVTFPSTYSIRSEGPLIHELRGFYHAGVLRCRSSVETVECKRTV